MSSPVPIFGTQDLHDDDAAVIDSYLIETDAPPDMTAAEQPIPPTPDKGITTTTRLISTELIWRTAFTEPQLLLPADSNRTQYHIRVISQSSSTTDGIRIASNKNEARYGARVQAGQTTGAIDNHTGAIWAWAENIANTPDVPVALSGTLNIEIMAVTK